MHEYYNTEHARCDACDSSCKFGCIDGEVCAPCNKNCITCTGVGIDYCLSCSSGAIRSDSGK
jgi:hypothetical protein